MPATPVTSSNPEQATSGDAMALETLSRVSLLVLDPLPQLRAAHYAAWAACGTRLTLESDPAIGVRRAFAALRGVAFTAILYPASDAAIAPAIRQWAALHEPGYRRRLVGYAEAVDPDLVPALTTMAALDGTDSLTVALPPSAPPEAVLGAMVAVGHAVRRAIESSRRSRD